MRKLQRNSISQDSQSLDGLGNAVQEEACSKTLAHGQQWETISWRSIIAFKLIQVSTLLIQLGPARHLNGILIASAFYFFFAALSIASPFTPLCQYSLQEGLCRFNYWSIAMQLLTILKCYRLALIPVNVPSTVRNWN